MNRHKSLMELRQKLSTGDHSIGSWIQIPHPSVAEIMGSAQFDWVAVDMEHGSVSTHQLPDIFRALELGETLGFARLPIGEGKECKQALDAGAAGIIIPCIENARQLEECRDACCWPPAGTRGVGFSRANLFGREFEEYRAEAQAPFLVAMIESTLGVEKLPEILEVEGLDAILIGPYDLSASLGITGNFEHPEFINCMKLIRVCSDEKGIPVGVHVVEASEAKLRDSIADGYRFLPYSIDSVMLNSAVSIEL